MTGRPVRGLVVDAAGDPVAGARVTIVESPSPMPELSMLADEHGCFSLALQPGRFVLRADGDAGDWGIAEVDPTVAFEVRIVVAPRARCRQPED